MGGFIPKPPGGFIPKFNMPPKPGGGNRPSTPTPMQQQRDSLNQRMDAAARSGNNDYVKILQAQYDALGKK